MNSYLFPILLTTIPVAGALPDEPVRVDYLREVKPILSARCFACHAATMQKGGLRIDTAALMRKGGDNGSAIVSGNSAASLLIKRVIGAKGFSRMPPRKDGDPLEPEQIAVLRRWINQGAKAPDDEKPETDPRDHWAYKKPVRPSVPVVKNTKWVGNPIDAFVAKQHEQHGLSPQPPVEKRLLLRRVYLDLIGLPPTEREMAAFVNDKSSDAYEKVVDRLLASPQYGERWGRHWMDIWRYSDWWGLGQQLRNSQKHIWHWRDWIVESLNKDKGYDRMILEMLAADELYPTDWDALRGTGFLARQYFLFNRNTWLDETVEHTSKAFLGLTMNCVKCHTHKYDPIEHEDYYRFRAFFEPYQVRLDQAKGETDFEKNGVPRVFDCNLETPTYLHFRGNAQRPDKSSKIKPGIPEFFASGSLKIKPVKLPPVAYQPGLRAVTLENYLQAAIKQLADAKAELAKAKTQLADAKKRSEQKPKPAKVEPSRPPGMQVRESFAEIDPEIWKTEGGKWAVEKGKVIQKQIGNQRAVLTLKQSPPSDFEARFRFAILGGDRYRSVGVAFDANKDREYMVYLTACAGQERVQFTYKEGGRHVYPPNRQMRKVLLNESQEMKVRVRGSLLNVFMNDQFAFACRLPKGRQPGQMQLITFDAAARFEQFSLSKLSSDTKLVQPDEKPSPPAARISETQAQTALEAAEKAVAAAEQQIATLKARAAADNALAMLPNAKETKKLIAQAAMMEKKAEVANAERELAKAQLQQARNKNKKTLESVKKAQAALAKANNELAKPATKHTPLRGALKSLESNLETSAAQMKPFPKTSTGRRSALAKWIASRDNPLTARVAVNHLWAKHFGQPLVPTVFDFGLKGTPPTHPDLLNWLAVEFMENGWSMKHVHRLIVTSNTYRMTSSSAGAPKSNSAKDADNLYYWRMPAKRMQSQVVRDSLLHLAGELDLTLGGPSIEGGQQATSRRRSLYFFHSAIKRNQFLTTFDEADPLDCYRRRESIVPQQALALANSKLAIDMAEKITERLEQKWSKLDDRAFARKALTLLLCYEPNEKELSACEQAMQRWRGIFSKQADAQRQTRKMLVQALLNHNDFITIR